RHFWAGLPPGSEPGVSGLAPGPADGTDDGHPHRSVEYPISSSKISGPNGRECGNHRLLTAT
ncbi:hypothetical protein ACSTHW_23625, partial [Vibrio parahaemolyticus]